MATNRSRSPTSITKARRFDQHDSKGLTKTNFTIQNSPPLSIRQYVRNASTEPPGGKQWQPTGAYHPPAFRGYYMSGEIRVPSHQPEPIWHPCGPYRDKRPTSLSPEKRKEKMIQEPTWHPPGKYRERPIPYFDPPSLRWSIQDLLRSMLHERSKSMREFSSTTNSERDEKAQDI